MKRIIFGLLVFLCVIQGAFAFNIALSDQGTGVREKGTGTLLDDGNLTVLIYDNLTGGNLIYNETFDEAINSGSWNVMLGERVNLSLSFGEIYYRDYLINGEDANFTDADSNVVPRQFFFSPLGEISRDKIETCADGEVLKTVSGEWVCALTSADSLFINDSTTVFLTNKSLNVSGNVTAETGFFEFLGTLFQQITRLFVGEVVAENITVNDTLIVNGTLIVQGKQVCLSDGTNCINGSGGGGNASLALFTGTTSASYDGNVGGYQAANAICAAEFSGSHVCGVHEILDTINNVNVSTISAWNGTAWISGGPPGFTANANDCLGWTNDSNTNLGKFWFFGDTTDAGRGWMINCANTKPFACCS